MKIYKDDIKEFSPFIMLTIAIVFIIIGGANKAADMGLNDNILAFYCGMLMIIAFILMILFWIMDL